MTSDTPAVLLLAIALAASALVMIRRFDIHRYVSITGVCFISTFAAYGVTAIPWGAGVIGPYYPFGAPSHDYAFVVAGAFVFFVIGAAISASLQSFDLRRAQLEFFARPQERGELRLPLLAAGIFSCVTVIIWFALPLAGSALLFLISRAGDSSAIFEFRLAANQSAGAASYVLSIIGAVVGPVLLLSALNLARRGATHEKRDASALAIVLSLSLVATAIAALHRAPVVYLLLFVGANAFLSRFPRPRVGWRVLLAVAALLVIVGGMTYYLTDRISPFEAARRAIDRVFLGGAQPSLDGFLQTYPRLIPFNNGQGIGLFARVLGITDYQTPALLVGYAEYGRPNFNLTCFWACDLWASFGYPAVLIGSLLVGALAVTLDRFCLTNMRNTAVGVALYAFMIVQVVEVAYNSIFTMLLSGGLVLAPALAWFLEHASSRRRKPSSDNHTESAA